MLFGVNNLEVTRTVRIIVSNLDSEVYLSYLAVRVVCLPRDTSVMRECLEEEKLSIHT